MKSIVFATNNPHKLAEIRDIAGDRLHIMSLEEIGCHDDIPETADTLEGNAAIKARWVRDRYGCDCFADDTGLMVDALDGRPGVYSARFAGPQCSAKDNVDLLLRLMEGKDNRAAHFSTVIAWATASGVTFFEGRVDGEILTERHGEGGFGYDPVFRPVESTLSFAEMTEEAKNAISHRGRATSKFLDHLLNPSHNND